MTLSPLISPVAVTAYQCVSAGGDDVEALYTSLIANRTCLSPLTLFAIPFETLVGEVRSTLPAIRSSMQAYDCRNARLALKALNQGAFRTDLERARASYGAGRVGLILGTSTSGIYDSENAYARLLQEGAMPKDFEFLQVQTAQATAEFLQRELGLQGPCYAISTACSSSAKALAVGQRLIATGCCDAVLVAGVDSLCRLTLRGFNSLQLIAPDACRPMDADRQGINIGEGAALLLLEKPSADNAGRPRLLAVGESSDAHHMSAPHPDGVGAATAMAQALRLAGREVGEVDYINLHATASSLNDQSEARAVVSLFPNPPPCSGVKGLLGHTLGAAGAVETVVSLLALDRGFLPGTCGLRQPDPQCLFSVIAAPNLQINPRLILSNAFGFGGNNASVLLEAA
ncbi:3-oxoacyl-[ACP] synthase (EC 2.3.1.41) FabV like [Methylomonas albis]|uniref:Beta-ketoacyl-ACP synthase n=1 Tax=Methylomonas albis TaxID=1854563 RepID=A0ABR9D0V3_9GAMM|nr:beta-ketoacyl-ACP synthase [Methylomonas albis]MBD9355854.1 beta-ketoacyl-ACP synthase [Methylomonas albis]CAD6878879.1 3-oxoacyl-[ACP] synthase (EC 2.3.1.41) FabV like [Methylomonas albis]